MDCTQVSAVVSAVAFMAMTAVPNPIPIPIPVPVPYMGIILMVLWTVQRQGEAAQSIPWKRLI